MARRTLTRLHHLRECLEGRLSLRGTWTTTLNKEDEADNEPDGSYDADVFRLTIIPIARKGLDRKNLLAWNFRSHLRHERVEDLWRY